MPERSRPSSTLHSSTSRPVVEVLRSAASDPSRPLDRNVRQSLEHRLGYDFGSIRVHSGGASEAAAGRLGARAYTLGRDIHLGAEAVALTGQQRARLLAHEAVHTVQQGGTGVTPSEQLSVSHPRDAAESEAAHIAASLQLPTASRVSARGRTGEARGTSAVTRMAAPQIQRDLTGKKPVKDGDFNLDLKTISRPGGSSGMFGTVKFKANENAPDSTSIRLLQIVRDVDIGTNPEKDLTWGGDQENIEHVKTTASKGVEPGFFVDIPYKGTKPRKAKKAPALSPYYIDPYRALKIKENKHGSKKGKAVTEASLRDFPNTNGKIRFLFETAAMAADNGYVYASLTWGFTVSDPANGTVEKENAEAHRSPSATVGAAVTKFNEFFQNPGSSKAPK